MKDDGLKPLLQGRQGDRGMATVAMEGILLTTEIDNDIELLKKGVGGTNVANGHLSIRLCVVCPFVTRRVRDYNPTWRATRFGTVAEI